MRIPFAVNQDRVGPAAVLVSSAELVSTLGRVATGVDGAASTSSFNWLLVVIVVIVVLAVALAVMLLRCFKKKKIEIINFTLDSQWIAFEEVTLAQGIKDWDIRNPEPKDAPDGASRDEVLQVLAAGKLHDSKRMNMIRSLPKYQRVVSDLHKDHVRVTSRSDSIPANVRAYQLAFELVLQGNPDRRGRPAKKMVHRGIIIEPAIVDQVLFQRLVSVAGTGTVGFDKLLATARRYRECESVLNHTLLDSTVRTVHSLLHVTTLQSQILSGIKQGAKPELYRFCERLESETEASLVTAGIRELREYVTPYERAATPCSDSAITGFAAAHTDMMCALRT